jgi:catechol 2,3-dioxygenase-like lactoylglutathione lyase family enzyme
MSHITQPSTVFVPVSDHDAAIAFYAGTLGFEKLLDFTYAGGERWVELAPPGTTSSVALVSGGSPGIETRLAWDSADVEADHAAFTAAGADVTDILREGDPPVRWGGAVLAGIPPMFLVRDPDGNSFLIVQQP